MARPSKHTNHPLFKLRKSLGVGSPVPQKEFARLLDLPNVSLQAVEAGRRSKRGIQRALLQRIRLYIGAVWNEERDQWLFDLRLLRATVKPGQEWSPVTPELFAAYKRVLAGPLRQDQRDSDQFLFESWATELFTRIPNRFWHRFASRFGDFIEVCCQDFSLGDPREFFAKVAEDKRAVLDALNEEHTKGIAARELFNRADTDLQRALSIFGPESEKGQAIIKLRNELTEDVKRLPPEAAKKRHEKSKNKKLK